MMSHVLINTQLSVLGTGSALPGMPIGNAELARLVTRVGASDSAAKFIETLAHQMGIETRHLCRDFREASEVPRPHDTNPELAARAISAALVDANLEINGVDYIISHTTTPHTLLPPNISWAADILGYSGPYMELRQACTGFANALTIASGLLLAGIVKTVAIVGSETGSVFVDVTRLDQDRSQRVNVAQMGDGAGATILTIARDRALPYLDYIYFGNAGSNKESAFSLTVGGSSQPFTGKDGGVFSFKNRYDLSRQHGLALFERGYEVLRVADDLLSSARIIPHQANGRMAELLAPLLNVNPQRFYNNACRVGNTGSAAIWIALDTMRKEKVVAKKDAVAVLGAEATKFLFGGFLYIEGAVG